MGLRCCKPSRAERDPPDEPLSPTAKANIESDSPVLIARDPATPDSLLRDPPEYDNVVALHDPGKLQTEMARELAAAQKLTAAGMPTRTAGGGALGLQFGTVEQRQAAARDRAQRRYGGMFSADYVPARHSATTIAEPTAGGKMLGAGGETGRE